jgi:uncharacterized protein YaaW (UPF0174 family)
MKKDQENCPNTHFYGNMLIFLAGMASSYNLAVSFAALVVISTAMHVVTLKHDHKRRAVEHFTSWLLGTMMGFLIVGRLILPYFDIYPRVNLLNVF